MSGCRHLWRQRFLLLVLLLATIALSACGSHYVHVVERGETLYSIGWAYGKDYREIARWNGIEPPYQLQPGQRLRIVPPDAYEVGHTTFTANNKDASQINLKDDRETHVAPVSPPVATTDTTQKPGASSIASTQAKNTAAEVVQAAKAFFSSGEPVWHWPAEGQLSQTYLAKDPRRQGVDIAGSKGNPIKAAASGKVVYAGSGLQRYGKLIIVKHNETFLSAYAHNNKLRVKEGEMVKAGQRIADMGDSGTNQTMLHFEIRQNGKPVNPLRYLPKRGE